ncbi:carbohydrate ABC transporter permease [Phytomonospora endophytica]|uniref:Lactose/L-arabinose transport system permease protein n=1 Tax=Phytomonospora endophytica TaxID=714109 RepID=A0A841G2E6_9ACTN|nr:sugar ABC transporter permease [Phytomonospora endophytica]MBB6038869.1 lactose/L-arabinose transport system permease protein [Phytomonospora endophytica]GIG68336.1 lactose ABC transporter permease [Phytomonospora endophytica]
MTLLAEARAPAEARTKPSRRKPRLAPWAFIGPAIGLFTVFFAYPLVASLVQSFQTDERGETVWAGLANYRRLLGDPLMPTALGNTAIILAIQVPLMLVLALLLAQILNQSWLRMRTGYRIAYFLPAVTTLVAYAIVFRVLLRADSGVLNQLLGLVGLPGVDWLNDPVWAKVALIASITWKWTGYNMVILLAGLQAIPREQYEAAAVDGAGPVTTYVKVVVPQLRPVILFCLITSTIGTLQLFDEPYLLTGGGPDNATLTPIIYLYQVGFQQLDFGYASAIAWVVVLLIGALSLLQFKALGRRG